MRTRVCTLVAFAVCGCSNAPPPTPDQIPISVTIAGGSVTSGFASGVLRSTTQLAGFRMTTHPISVGDYAQCISVGACSTASLNTGECSRQPSTPAAYLVGNTSRLDSTLPMTCASVAQAKAYCAWQGGALPTLEQWELAARAAAPTRHAWGNGALTCDLHPGADWHAGNRACGTMLADFGIGKHPKGASPFGVEDVLLARGELLSTTSQSTFEVCRRGDACVVSGAAPGTIDNVRPFSDDSEHNAVGFRCAWGAQ